VKVQLPIAESPRPATRDEIRSRRVRAVRAKTISTKRMTKRELAFGKMLADAQLEELGDVVRPVTRADCERGERPCPFVSCEHHLYLDVSDKTGAVKLNFPDIEADMGRGLEEMPATCALDVADEGPQTLERTGELMNLTPERVRQIEVKAYKKLAPLVRALFRDVTDAPREPGLPKTHDEVERDEGAPALDVRQVTSAWDEFFIRARIEEAEEP
jgi:hypothetical protein